LIWYHPFQWLSQAKAVVDQLGHHRTFDAWVACLYWISRFALHIHNPPRLELHLQATKTVAELTGTLNHAIGLEDCRFFGKVKFYRSGRKLRGCG
jgi:hypothetical protein